MLNIGFVVNPVAGIGGPAGLAGSDGIEIQRLASAMGSVSRSDLRASEFLSALSDDVRVVATGAGAMGQQSLELVGRRSDAVIPSLLETNAGDTTAVARRSLELGAELVIFVGGDGTARDVMEGIGEAGTPLLGIPAGVKMHSSVFALSSKTAGALVTQWRPHHGVETAEVVDIDESARRAGKIVTRLYGTAQVPKAPHRIQSRKVGAGVPSKGSVEALAASLSKVLDPASAWVFGPGTTLAAVATRLGLDSSLLGVDVVLPNSKVHLGNSASELEELTANFRVQLVLSPVGGQGFLLGRGNQQISAKVLKRVAKSDLIVLATPGKLAQLGGASLLLDTGSATLDEKFSGYRRVLTGQNDASVLPIRAASEQ